MRLSSLSVLAAFSAVFFLCSNPASADSAPVAQEATAPAATEEPSVHIPLLPTSEWIEYDTSSQHIPLVIKAPKNLSMKNRQQDGGTRVVLGNVDKDAGLMVMYSIDAYTTEQNKQAVKDFEALRHALLKEGVKALGEDAEAMGVQILKNEKEGLITYGSQNDRSIIVIVVPFNKNGVKGGISATIVGKTTEVTKKLAQTVFNTLKEVHAPKK